MKRVGWLYIALLVGCGRSNSDSPRITADGGATHADESTLRPDYPIVEGEFALSNDWTVTLPGRFNRRFQDGSFIIWRPGLTVHVIVWINDKDEPKADRLAWIKETVSSDAFDLHETQEGEILRYSYQLTE